MTHQVAVLVRHGVMPLELGIVHQILGRATSADGKPLYEITTCAVEPGQVRTDADFPITVGAGPEALAAADTVVIPATHEPDETETDGVLGPGLAAAFELIRPRTRIASICTGSFALAAAGLLDGKKATTHWRSADDFRRLFPQVELDPEVLYTDNGNVLTSAGEASGIDLCLHLVRRDFGAAVANDVARTTVVPPYRDGGQAQFIRHPIPASDDTSTSQAREWALRRLDRPISLKEWAGVASMSVRTFTRRFRGEVGLSAAKWLARQRLDHAKHLLEATDQSVEQIAAAVGFGTAVSLRQHLHGDIGVSPTAYRATFRGHVA